MREGAGYRAAMAHIADRLWPDTEIADVAGSRICAQEDPPIGMASHRRPKICNIRRAAISPKPSSRLCVRNSRPQMLYVAAMKNIVTQWRRVFRDETFSGYVDLQSIARTVIDNALANGKRHEQETTSLGLVELVGYSLAVASSILGFTPAAEISRPSASLRMCSNSPPL